MKKIANIPETMKAVICYGPLDYRYEENWKVPEITEDDVLVKFWLAASAPAILNPTMARRCSGAAAFCLHGTTLPACLAMSLLARLWQSATTLQKVWTGTGRIPQLPSRLYPAVNAVSANPANTGCASARTFLAIKR